MTIVNIKINGREYHLACDDGQEEHLRLLADDVDDRVRALSFSIGANPGEAMGLLLTALTMADEIIENKKEIKKIAAEVRHLTHMLESGQQQAQEARIQEIEMSMAATLEQITQRIERIAERVEMR